MDKRVQEIINENGLNTDKKAAITNEQTTEQRVEELLKQYGNTPNKPAARTSTTPVKGAANIRQAQAMPGIEYRVQCGAFRDRSQAAGILASKYGITEQIQEEYHDGYYKYTVGSFDTYEKAVKFRDAFIQRSKIWSAFIVAYRDGKRLAKITDAYR
jgi:cell division protein FtsN